MTIWIALILAKATAKRQMMTIIRRNNKRQLISLFNTRKSLLSNKLIEREQKI